MTIWRRSKFSRCETRRDARVAVYQLVQFYRGSRGSETYTIIISTEITYGGTCDKIISDRVCSNDANHRRRTAARTRDVSIAHTHTHTHTQHSDIITHTRHDACISDIARRAPRIQRSTRSFLSSLSFLPRSNRRIVFTRLVFFLPLFPSFAISRSKSR